MIDDSHPSVAWINKPYIVNMIAYWFIFNGVFYQEYLRAYDGIKSTLFGPVTYNKRTEHLFFFLC